MVDKDQTGPSGSPENTRQEHGLKTIRDLALIGDRRTAAVIARDGTVVWYCPDRFDYPSIFASLLDRDAGFWAVDLPGASPGTRRYVEDSGVLETCLCSPAGDLTIIDWMPAGRDTPPDA